MANQNKAPLSESCYCEFPTPRGFIGSGSHNGKDDVGRYHVSICMNCGRIHVQGMQNGEWFNVSFNIVLDEQVAAIQRYIDYLRSEER